MAGRFIDSNKRLYVLFAALMLHSESLARGEKMKNVTSSNAEERGNSKEYRLTKLKRDYPDNFKKMTKNYLHLPQKNQEKYCLLT